MSDYLFLFRGGFPMYEGWSPEEMQQHFKKWGGWCPWRSRTAPAGSAL